MGLAGQLGLSPFQGSVNLDSITPAKPDTTA